VSLSSFAPKKNVLSRSERRLFASRRFSLAAHHVRADTGHLYLEACVKVDLILECKNTDSE